MRSSASDSDPASPPAGGARVAVIGCGRIGSGWAEAFVAAGHEVVVQDAVAAQLDALTARLAVSGGAVATTQEPSEAVRGASLVIEAVPDDKDLKRSVFGELAPLVEPDAIVASSSSWAPISELVPAELEQLARRALVWHPFNPANLIPLVEVVPGPRTDADAVDATLEWLRSIGKQPVLLRSEVPGFIGNRLQLALLREALSLVASGVCTAMDVDRVVSASFALRLPFIGPLANEIVSGTGYATPEMERYLSHLGEIEQPLAVDDELLSGLDDQLAGIALATDRLQELRDSGVRRIVQLRTELLETS